MTYRSPFEQWDEQASVRVMTAGGHQWRRDAAGDWFPAESWSVANHRAVAEAGRRQEVLAALLLGYLDFTIHLEALCIGPVSRDMVLRRLKAKYDAAVVRDALRVQCDEAYHALMCEELAQHTAEVVGMQRKQLPEHLFFRRVRELSARACGPLAPEQYAFCVAVVAETIITDSLQKDWRDDALRPEVRDVLLHHFKDEVRHTRFFSQALQIVWPQWAGEVQEAMAPLWPELVLAFTRVDADVTAAALTMAGFTPEQAGQIVAESLEADGAAAERSASYDLTLRALRKAGVLRGESEYRDLEDRLSPGAKVD